MKHKFCTNIFLTSSQKKRAHNAFQHYQLPTISTIQYYNNNQRAILHQNNNEPHLKMTNIDGTTEPSQLNQEKRRKLNNTTHLQKPSNKLEIKHPLFTSKHINFTNKTKPTLTNSIKNTRTLLRQPPKNQQHQKPSKRNALF